MIDLTFKKELSGPKGTLLLDINTSIEKGSLVTLYGKSGVGKTSILRIIAGLLTPEDGTIKVDDTIWLDTASKVNLKPQKRNVGFVFQDYALFPNMTVKENLEFALDTKSTQNNIKDLIELVELGDLQHRKPTTLSGGQQQRVALARALVKKPTILMLDEPLSALDIEIRYKLQQYILKVHQEFNLTTLLISHDISEIIRLSDQIIEIEDGKISRTGTPNDLFNRQDVNAKFQFTGILLKIDKQDFIYILTIRIGKDVVKVVADESEGSELKIGDTILVASKAFNPIIHKIQ